MGKARSMLKEVAVHHPMALFTPGVPVELEQLSILFDSKDEDGNLYDIQIYKFDNRGNIEQDITASRGKVSTDQESQLMTITLYDAIITSSENQAGSKDQNVNVSSNEFRSTFEYGKSFNAQVVSRRDKYLTAKEIFARSIIQKRRGIDTTPLETEMNQRVALALAPIAFMLLGMPMAIRTSRRETSVGLFLSVLLAGIYFGGVLISDALSQRPELYPQYVVWIPPLLYQLFGALYLRKIAKM